MEHNARNEAKHTEPVQKASEKAAKKTRQSGQRLTPAQREEQILQVAAAHFAQHGVVVACMSSIAREASITRALLLLPRQRVFGGGGNPARSTGCS